MRSAHDGNFLDILHDDVVEARATVYVHAVRNLILSILVTTTNKGKMFDNGSLRPQRKTFVVEMSCTFHCCPVNAQCQSRSSYCMMSACNTESTQWQPLDPRADLRCGDHTILSHDLPHILSPSPSHFLPLHLPPLYPSPFSPILLHFTLSRRCVTFQ